MSGSNAVPLSSAGGNKQRKTKDEILRATVGIFLAQKNIMNIDKCRKSDVILLQSKRNFMLRKMLETDTCNNNSFLYSNVICMANNHYLMDQQFARFSEHVEAQSNLIRPEMRRFYAPMICHLYLDLLKANETKAAMNFLRKYAHLVAPVETYEAPANNTTTNGCSLLSPLNNDSNPLGFERNEDEDNLNGSGTCGSPRVSLNIRFATPINNNGNSGRQQEEQNHQMNNNDDAAITNNITMDDGVDPELEFFTKLIQKLSTCHSIESLQMDADIVHFFSSKYELHSSSRILSELLYFLEKKGHVLLLHLIINCIHVRILDNEIQNLSEETILMPATEYMNDLVNTGDENEFEANDLEQRELNNDDIKMDDHLTTTSVNLPPSSSSLDGMKSTNSIDRKRSLSQLDTSDPIEIIEPKLEPIVEDEQLDVDPAACSSSSSNHKLKNTVQQCLQAFRRSREEIVSNRIECPARVIKINDNNEQRLCGACLDVNECHLVGGFNNSSIRLWQMNEHCTVGGSLYGSRSTRYCHWDINHTLSEDKDEMLMDIEKYHTTQWKTSNRIYLDNSDKIPSLYYAKKYADNSYNIYGGVPLRGHRAGVTGVRFSMHHPLLYSVSKDGNMRCWRPEDLGCIAVYKGHRYPIWCVDESPAGMYLATGSKDLTARLWSIEKEHPLVTFIGHTQDVECVSFHPNGNYLATGSSDSSVRLWCVSSGKLVRVFSDCKQPVYCLGFSPDGKMLAVGGDDTRVRIFDLAAGAQLHELKDHTTTIVSLAWSREGRQMASAGRDNIIRLWNVDKLQPSANHNTSSTHSSSSSSRSSNPSPGEMIPSTNFPESSGTLPPESAAGTSSSSNSVTLLPVPCQRVVNVFYDKNNMLSCLGC